MTFSYHRAVAPMIWVLVCIASVELVVTHLLVALWRPDLALVLSVLSLTGLIWLVALIRSFARLPVLIEGDRLVMRVGTLKRVDVPRTQVAGLRASWDAEMLREPGTLKLSLLAYPNVVIDLDPPLPGRRRPVRAVAHRLDEPAAFALAFERWRGGNQRVGDASAK